MKLWRLLLLPALLLGGCVLSLVELDTTGLKHQKCDLEIRFPGRAQGEFIDENWEIDGWEYKAMPPPPKYSRVSGHPSAAAVYLDMDGNGRSEKYPAYVTDLELRHRRHDGEIWVSSRELPKHVAQTNLDVFLDNYVESLAGVEFQPRRGPLGFAGVGARSYATTLVEERAGKFGSWDAIIATIEIANLEQLRLDEHHRFGSIRILIAKIDDFEPAFGVYGGSDQGPYSEQIGPPRSHQGLLVVGYFNTPKYFAAGVKDFDRFLGQFVVDGEPVDLEPLLTALNQVGTEAAPDPAAVVAKEPRAAADANAEAGADAGAETD